MFDFARNPRSAQPVGAENVCARLYDRAFAVRADRGLFDASADFFGVERAENFGDNLVGTADEDFSSLPHFLSENIAVIVESGFPDRRARKLDGFDNRKGGELARPADLPNYFFNRRYALFGFEFVGNRPAGEFIGIPQRFAERTVVQFDDRAVGKNVQTLPARFNLLDCRLHFVRAPAYFKKGKDLEAVAF